jgi:hypothetical protein
LDDELVAFTHSGGWLKIDKLLPLVNSRGWPFGFCEGWLNDVGWLTDNYEVSDFLFLWGSTDVDSLYICSKA